jgi:kynurenine formamidase
MKFFLEDGTYIDTEEPLDISLPLRAATDNPRAWYVSPPRMEPVRENGFLGSVSEGGSVNFRDIYFNPHGHGTHTECLGHITPIVHSVNNTLKSFFFQAVVISIEPELIHFPEGTFDRVISKQQIEKALDGLGDVEAVILRTLPNSGEKKFINYSSTNPPYLAADVVDILDAHSVKHLMVDLPSVDRESDEGKLAFHHRFWSVPGKEDKIRTITELIFVPDDIADGIYLLEIQMAPFENDASPSRPVLYKKYVK